MTDTLDLNVVYNNKHLVFKTQVIPDGYTQKFEVDVNGTPVVFEPDESLHYKAVNVTGRMALKLDAGLLEAIAASLSLSLA
jgi:hypothetical protein